MSLNCATIEDDEGGTGTGAATKGGILFIVVNNSAILKRLNRKKRCASRIPVNGESTSKVTLTLLLLLYVRTCVYLRSLAFLLS